MTSQLNVDTIVDKAGSGGSNVKMANTSTYVSDGGNVTQNTVQGLAKAWVHTDMVGTAAILDSFNIGSLTDSGSGTFAHTFSNNMAGADRYAMTGMTGATDGNGNDHCLFSRAAPTANGMSILVTANNAAIDRPDNFIVVHGDLA